MNNNKKLNLAAPISQTGYGQVGFNVVKELVRANVDVCLSLPNIPNSQLEKYLSLQRTGEDLALLLPLVQKFKNEFHYDSDCVGIWHQFEMQSRYGRGKLYGWPIFELNKFSEVEKHHLRYPDELIVCSKWAADIVSAELNRDAIVIPLGVDRDIFSSENFANNNATDSTIFMNCGKWEYRKGHDVLPEIFNKAFLPTDDVELWLCCNNPFLSALENRNWQNLYLDTPLGKAGKIKFFGPFGSQYELASIMSQCDCGVFPSRAEGWNLEALELLSMGKNIVITNYSAHQEFCNSKNSYLINIDNEEDAFDGKWFYGNGQWAEIENLQVDEFVGCLRFIHKNKAKTQNDEGIDTAKRFSWKNSTELLMAKVFT